MRILQISPQISYPLNSGGRLGIYGITKSLAERGHSIIFLTYVKKHPSPETINELEKICQPIFIKMDTRNTIKGAFLNMFSPIPYNVSKYYSIKLKNFLIEFLKTNEVDIVHIDHLHMAWTIDFIRKITNVPIVIREHNLEMKIMERFFINEKNIFLKLYSFIQYEKFKLYEPKECAKFDKCLMISKEDEQSILKFNNAVKTIIVPAGVDDNLLKIKGHDNLDLSLFHIGSLEWQPNYDGLVWFLKDIFPSILKNHPNTKIYIYGKGITKLKLPSEMKGNIILRGYVDDIWEEIADKTILIVPLKVGGGMRVKIIEMMAAGKIIVSTTIGREGIDVNDNENILIADDTESFVSKILFILNNQIDVEKLRMNAKNKIIEKYSWKKIAEDIENIYKLVIEEKGISK